MKYLIKNGRCKNQRGTYDCECSLGYHNNNIPSARCVDIDECETFSNICKNGKCTNIDGSFMCSCNPGYKLDMMNKNCEGT